MLNRKGVTVYAKIKAKYSVTKEVEINLKKHFFEHFVS